MFFSISRLHSILVSPAAVGCAVLSSIILHMIRQSLGGTIYRWFEKAAYFNIKTLGFLIF